ncbi:hypothetical protein [Methylorubrum aminovorans]
MLTILLPILLPILAAYIIQAIRKVYPMAALFLYGPRESIDLMRELRDLARRQTADTGRIAECVRVIREETKRQTELLGLIEWEQAIENPAHHDRD